MVSPVKIAQTGNDSTHSWGNKGIKCKYISELSTLSCYFPINLDIMLGDGMIVSLYILDKVCSGIAAKYDVILNTGFRSEESVTEIETVVLVDLDTVPPSDATTTTW